MTYANDFKRFLEVSRDVFGSWLKFGNPRGPPWSPPAPPWSPRPHRLNIEKSEDWRVGFLIIFGKLSKIQLFNFLRFSWPRVHKKLTNIRLINFLHFHDPGYTKINKNPTLQFSPMFMTLGTRKLTKIRHLNFLRFSWRNGKIFWIVSWLGCGNYSRAETIQVRKLYAEVQ